MRVLVTAATKHGATREIAQVIGDALRDQGLDPTVIEPEQVDTVDDYDAVVLGSAVYAGRWLKPAKQLVDRCGGALSARPVWLFSSGPIGDPPKPEEDPADVAEILAVTRAREHRLFAGKLMMLKMRHDYEEQQGGKYSLKGFHDAVLGNGCAPFWAHRQMLLGTTATDAPLE